MLRLPPLVVTTEERDPLELARLVLALDLEPELLEREIVLPERLALLLERELLTLLPERLVLALERELELLERPTLALERELELLERPTLELERLLLALDLEPELLEREIVPPTALELDEELEEDLEEVVEDDDLLLPPLRDCPFTGVIASAIAATAASANLNVVFMMLNFSVLNLAISFQIA